MSFSQLMPGDILPITLGGGETEVWEVREIRTNLNVVDLKLFLQVETRTEHPAEKRRRELESPHSKIRTTIPESWIDE
jgi:hypothetical protein